MKRSEAIKLIIKELILPISGYCASFEQQAEGILNKLEKEGILPPGIRMTYKEFNEPMKDNDIVNSNWEINKWEPEE